MQRPGASRSGNNQRARSTGGDVRLGMSGDIAGACQPDGEGVSLPGEGSRSIASAIDAAIGGHSH